MEGAVALLLKNQFNELIIMKYWPIPNSYSKKLPSDESYGSFWEKRGDRYHCGIDIYAPSGSEVISIDNGIVIETGIFTSPNKIKYWNQTKYVLIQNQDDLFCKYAELGSLSVKTNESIKAGQLLGYVGTVLNIKKITKLSPQYIQKIKYDNNTSMLHFEIYTSKPHETKKYLGGNWFGNNKPINLINPNNYMK